MIHPRKGAFNTGTYDLFAITEMGVKTIGLFDENLYPAYGEDSDFIMRIINLDPKTIKELKHSYFHGNELASCESYEDNGQQSSKEEPDLGPKLLEVNNINFEYLDKKWGGWWRGLSPSKYPFDNSDYPQSYTTWDINFIRRKYLGF